MKCQWHSVALQPQLQQLNAHWPLICQTGALPHFSLRPAELPAQLPSVYSQDLFVFWVGQDSGPELPGDTVCVFVTKEKDPTTS